MKNIDKCKNKLSAKNNMLYRKTILNLIYIKKVNIVYSIDTKKKLVINKTQYFHWITLDCLINLVKYIYL